MAQFTEWSELLEQELAAPFPPECVQEKTMGGRKVFFVAWWRYPERLNLLLGGGWSMETPIVMHVGEKLIMGVPVTILGVTRINFGDEDDDEYETVVDPTTGEEKEKKTMYGSPVTNAFAQGFKRTCAMFGLGLSMYDKKRPTQQYRRPAPSPQQQQPKNGPTEAARLRLKGKLDMAIEKNLVTAEEASRVEAAFLSQELKRIESASAWLDAKLEPIRLGAQGGA